jgi:hypothetical protein
LLKKIISILLILVFLFNLVGYRFVTEYLQHRADKQLSNQLDRNIFDETQLVEIKVPLNLPYQSNWAAYQRYDGALELGGVLYQYVKRKVSNDTLYLLCIPNMKKMRLETAKNELFKLTIEFNQNDNAAKSGNSRVISFKSLQGEYDDYSFAIRPCFSIELNTCWPVLQEENLISTPRPSPEQPPDAISI